MESSTDPATTVISLLKDRNIRAGRDDIESAFNDATTHLESVKWVEEHLSPDTLLSQEELALYSKLDSSGILRNILHDSDTGATRPLHDGELRKATDLLNASTGEIRKQVDILAAQQENLRNQRSVKNEQELRSARDVERLRSKHELGRQNTSSASSDLAQELEIDLKSETEKAVAEGKRILSSLTARLKEDDKVILNLEKTASTIQGGGDDSLIIKRTLELESLLARYLAEEIHCRLDRLYLEGIESDNAGFNNPTGIEDDAWSGLSEELEALYPEIEILAEMSTKQQCSGPILRELQNHHGKQRIASHEKLDNISDIIGEMTSSAKDLTKSLQTRESLCGILESFTSTYRLEMGDRFSEQSAPRRDTLRRLSTAPMAAFAPDRVDSAPETPVLANLMRRVGLSYESVLGSEEKGGGATELAEKRKQALECLRSYSIAADSPLKDELIPKDQASMLLLSSLETNSQFQSSLVDLEHERGLEVLESELGRLQKGMQKLDLDVIYRRDKAQSNFMEQWS
ncbi:hypothetical protein P168DRAFT_268499 [Aspergillus campestris IBT 28561]|uniref:Vacuolar H+/Ca2+ exchanger n=1 Tax=Aspergillus campestris (strain IBT 28561) TaxID=1392248 RepID=A0A2I1D618_ASPC2|nr:uncharacterized protein P168DRAFT_268499 [Aspergillus campestris IBT 28561]PKY05321.1 hypothetical protein P168DRAFT_268499 [Aspergillus campestris IBT 28561]